MRKIERLRREALKQATAKGHVMGRFIYSSYNNWSSSLAPMTGDSKCILCGRIIFIDTGAADPLWGLGLNKRCRPTIAYIAECNAAAGGHYFSRDTLRFFGQRRSDFKVHVRAERVFVQASSYQGGNYMGESFAEFNPKTGDVRSMAYPALSGEHRTKGSVADFLAGLGR